MISGPRGGRRYARALVTAAVLPLVAAVLAPRLARAEYRGYELEVTDILDCKLNKRDKCRSAHIVTSMSPDLYQQTNGGEERIGVQLLATWMCYGDTSGFREVCPRPATRNGKFNPGDDVRIILKKHITDGWRGKVEVAYFQADLGSNIYGVRFTERQNAYLRYFERDLERAGGTAGPAPAGPPGAEQPAAVPTPPGAPAAPATTAAPAAPAAPGAAATSSAPGSPPAAPAAPGAPAGPAATTAPAAPAPPAAPGTPAVPAPTAPPGPTAQPPR